MSMGKKKKKFDPYLKLYIKHLTHTGLKIKVRVSATQILGENIGVTFITLDLVMVS